MSDGLRAGSKLIEFLAPLLRSDFYLVDVGCSGGIDPGWRSFGDRLSGVGFDPNVVECERLASIEKQRVTYEPGFVAAPKRPFYIDRNPWHRLAVFRSTAIRHDKSAALSNLEKTQQNLWGSTKLSERIIALRDYLSGKRPDFFKIDIDGPDFDVMRSVDYADILGVSMEVNFIGGNGPDEHTFHNTDRFMRSQGFDLYFLSYRTYAMSALPAKYVSSHPAESVSGRPVQGDALYFRDIVATGLPVERDKVLKLACLFSLAGQHDSVADVLQHYRPTLLDIDVEAALDIICQEARGRSYKDHMALFEADDASFYSV